MSLESVEGSRNRILSPLRECLQSLSQTCYVTLPLRMIHVTSEQHFDHDEFENLEPESSPSTPLTALQSLVDMISEKSEIEDLVWSPTAAYARAISTSAMNDFERKLIDWKDKHLELIPELDTESALDALLVYRWSQFAIPPPPYTATTRMKSLAAAHYNFYRGRIRWALILLEDDVLRNKPTAEFFFYEALRHAASHAA